MKLAHYWARDKGEALDQNGEPIRIVSRGWSNESLEEARAMARDRALRVAERIASDSKSKEYLYGERPLPEPIVQEFQNRAVITRNMYGALVLNTSRLMFVDIDREDKPRSTGLLSFFSKRAPEPASETLTEIQRVAERNGLSARVYKTAAGYRLAITNAGFEAGNAQSEALLKEFGSDPLYVRLCRMQESFRARLTPKPWRCGFSMPPVSFPFETPAEESRFHAWQMKYEAASYGYATCRYMTSFGEEVAQEFKDLIDYHDEQTRAAGTLQLA